MAKLLKNAMNLASTVLAKATDATTEMGAILSVLALNRHCAIDIALENNDINIFEKLLMEQPGLQQAYFEQYGITLLIWLACLPCTKTREQMMRILLYNGANVNATDGDGNRALDYAATRENKTCFRMLVQEGKANVNLGDQYGMRALHLAVSMLDVELVGMCLKLGSEVDARSDTGLTALHLAACRAESSEVIRLLVKNGADVNAKDINQNTPLAFVVSRADSSAVDTLLELGADLKAKDDRGNQPLHLAAGESQLSLDEKKKIIRKLVDLGADMKLRNNEGKSALELAPCDLLDSALEADRFDEFRAILDKFPDLPSVYYSKRKMTLLISLAQLESTESRMRMAKLLLEGGSTDVNQPDAHGDRALDYAAHSKNKKFFKFLVIDGHASMNAKNAIGQIALHRAAGRSLNDAGLVSLCIEAGANVNAQDMFGQTALHHASSREIAKLLIESGADANIKDSNGCVALHYAATRDACITAELLSQGADAKIEDNDGETALDEALRSNLEVVEKKDIVRMLEKAFADKEALRATKLNPFTEA